MPAALLQITRTASEPIVPGDVVYATSASHVGVATFDATRDKAQAIGVAVTSAEAEEQVTIVMMGIISSPAFAIFGVNETLFLDQEGAITNDRPTAGFLTKVGKSLGSGEILIQLTDPLVLG